MQELKQRKFLVEIATQLLYLVAANMRERPLIIYAFCVI